MMLALVPLINNVWLIFCELANERHIPAEVLGRGLAERVAISSILACKVCVSQAAAARATAETGLQ
jgi:hypothetical protein